MRLPPRRRALLLAAAACTAPLAAQEPARFPAQTEAITVDVVVLDREGRPVRGLTPADFVLTEDGRPQSVVGFEARELPVPDAPRPGAAAPAGAPGVARPVASGRVFTLVIDDLGLTPSETLATRAAVARWISGRADARDQLTLVTTSGDVWWSDTVGRGRADFAAVLDRVRAKRTEATLANGAVTEQEAYQITVVERHAQAGELQSPYGETAIVASREQQDPPPPSQNDRSKTVAERVAVRFLNANLCQLNRGSRLNSMVQCYGMAEASAAEVYGAWTRRAAALLRTLHRAAADVRDLPGRKAIVLMTGELLRDRSLDRQFRDVIAAAQRANTAIYFGGARGLVASAFGAAESRTSLRSGDVTAMNVEQDVLAAAGAEHLAEATGGAAIVSNDLAAGLERMASDASAYYLLGYQPEHAPDGKWHDLEVKVARPGVTVRARRTYLSERPDAVVPRPAGGPTSLVAGGDRGALPVHAAAHVQAPDGAGGARVLIAVEVDGDRVQVEDGPAGATAALDLSIAAIARDRGTVSPLDQTLDLTLRPSERAGSWSLVREVRLPPGVAQVRARVRDRRSGLAGAVALRIEVPDVGGTYLSSPLLTDRTQPSGVAGEPPRLVPSATRQFRSGRTLFCQYELFGFAGLGLAGVARVRGGYAVTDANGQTVAAEAPTAIATDGTRVVRRLALPLGALPPGRYALTLSVEDQLGGRTFTASEPFAIEAPAPSGDPQS